MCFLGIKVVLLNEIGFIVYVDNGGVELFMFFCVFVMGNIKVVEISMV